MNILKIPAKVYRALTESYERHQYRRLRDRMLEKRGIPDEIPPPVFAVGTGRSGTHFLQRIMHEDLTISSWHIDTSDADSFMTYCEWNRLPVDRGGFLDARQSRIDRAAVYGQVYFESNPYVSLSVNALHERFSAKFVHIVRSPEKVVNSHYVKGWYKAEFEKDNPDLPLGYNPSNYRRTNHFFGRIVPNGDEFVRWRQLTRIGKIAWMWNAYHLRILADLDQIPRQNRVFVKLETIDYTRYCELHNYVGGETPMDSSTFNRIREGKPGRGPRQRTVEDWAPREREEYLQETAAARVRLGYE